MSDSLGLGTRDELNRKEVDRLVSRVDYLLSRHATDLNKEDAAHCLAQARIEIRHALEIVMGVKDINR